MFGNDNGANIIGKGTVILGTKKEKEENVLLVKDMTHNLLSVSQIYDHGHTCIFDSTGCEIIKTTTCKIVAVATRTPQNIYILDKVDEASCYMGKEDESWQWAQKTWAHKF